MTPNYIWIIELWNDEKKQWEPTVGAALNISGLAREKRVWKKALPDDKIRGRLYEGTDEIR